jgi:hypothetical protein
VLAAAFGAFPTFALLGEPQRPVRREPLRPLRLCDGRCRSSCASARFGNLEQRTALSQRRGDAEACLRPNSERFHRFAFWGNRNGPSVVSLCAPLRLCDGRCRSSCASARFGNLELRTALSQRRGDAEACLRPNLERFHRLFFWGNRNGPSVVSLCAPCDSAMAVAVPRVPQRASRSDVWLQSLQSSPGSGLPTAGGLDVCEADPGLPKEGILAAAATSRAGAAY